jgi:hypothetical protein
MSEGLVMAVQHKRILVLRARIKTLEKALRDAPHGRTLLQGISSISRTCSVNRNRPCDCWKAAAALEEKP